MISDNHLWFVICVMEIHIYYSCNAHVHATDASHVIQRHMITCGFRLVLTAQVKRLLCTCGAGLYHYKAAARCPRVADWNDETTNSRGRGGFLPPAVKA